MHLLINFLYGLIKLLVELAPHKKLSSKHHQVCDDQHKREFDECIYKRGFMGLIRVLEIKLEFYLSWKYNIADKSLVNSVRSIVTVILFGEIHMELVVTLTVSVDEALSDFVYFHMHYVFHSFLNDHEPLVSRSWLDDPFL
jgi:hypothetical protein